MLVPHTIGTPIFLQTTTIEVMVLALLVWVARTAVKPILVKGDVHDKIYGSGGSSRVRRNSFEHLLSSVETLYHITRAIDKGCFRLLFSYQEFQVSAVINPQRACVRGLQ